MNTAIQLAYLVAAVLLLAGGLKALQTASIAAALPFSVVMLVMCFGLAKSLIEEMPKVPDAPPEEKPAPAGGSAGE